MVGVVEPSSKTGLGIMLVGAILIALGFSLEYAARTGLLMVLATWFSSLIYILQFDLGPAVAAFGLGWLISGLHPMRKWYLYPSSGGLILSTSAFTTSILWGTPESFIPTATLLSLTWSVGPALMLAGVVSGIIVNRRASKHGVRPPPNPHEDNLDIAVIAALYIPLLPIASTQSFYVRYLLPAIITWVFWHMLADRFTTYLLMRLVGKGGTGVRLMSVETPSPEETTLMNVVSRSYYPMAFGLGVTTTVSSVLDLLNIQLFGGDPFAATAGAALASIVAIAAGSLYVGPVLWLYEDLGVRIFDSVRRVMMRPAIHSLAEEMVEIYTFIFAPISFTFVVADGDLLLALILLGLVFHLLLTISMTATYLYIRFSAKPHLRAVLERLVRKGVLISPHLG
ncbi:MAG: hypothetical protein QXV62_06010 [Nitrososphaerota archaeon]